MLVVSIKKAICRTTDFKVFQFELLLEYNYMFFTSFSWETEWRVRQASKLKLYNEIVDIEAVNYFFKKLHLRCLIGSSICTCSLGTDWLLNQLRSLNWIIPSLHFLWKWYGCQNSFCSFFCFLFWGELNLVQILGNERCLHYCFHGFFTGL